MSLLMGSQGHDGTAARVYGPPLPQAFATRQNLSPSSQVGLLEVVPQRPYVCGNVQKGWNLKPSILFTCGGRPGVKLLDAVSEMFKGMDDRDDFPFDEDARGITIRIHVGH